jgi:hypothetical protein
MRSTGCTFTPLPHSPAGECFIEHLTLTWIDADFIRICLAASRVPLLAVSGKRVRSGQDLRNLLFDPFEPREQLCL